MDVVVGAAVRLREQRLLPRRDELPALEHGPRTRTPLGRAVDENFSGGHVDHLPHAVLASIASQMFKRGKRLMVSLVPFCSTLFAVAMRNDALASELAPVTCRRA